MSMKKSSLQLLYEAILQTDPRPASLVSPLPSIPATPGLEGLAALSGLLSPQTTAGHGVVRLVDRISKPPVGGLKQDLETTVRKIFREVWSERDGEIVPGPEDLKLGNDAVVLNAAVLYADMSGSTKLVDAYEPQFAAEIYKTYLACAAPIIKDQGGVITAYDGDRIMGVFIGSRKNTNAVRAALRINGAVWDIIKPALKAQYPNTNYNPKHVIGVDTSKLNVCRIGVRNDNDLVWVGRAANYAAKLSSLSDEFHIYITHSVYDSMHDDVKYGGVNKEHMWEARVWTAMGNFQLYASTWKFGV